jgi:hypothetical protein
MLINDIARRLILTVALVLLSLQTASLAVEIKPASTPEGYLARLLLNEVPFPGERGWVSESDTKAAMVSILWVLHSRIAHIPPGYAQTELSAIRTKNIIDIITVGGVHGQCDGFYRDAKGRPQMVSRIPKRLNYLNGIASKGKPGRFARLLNHGQNLANAYFKGGIKEADRFAGITRVGNTKVTGRAYSWMTDKDYYHPGGDFIKIPNAKDGSLGGNRFSTVKERKKK